MTKRIALYTRVSQDSQNTENQRRELIAVAERNGWTIVAEYEDHGISGAKGRDQRPGYDALMKAVARREIDMVASWAVDRLGRSLQNLVGFLTEINAKGVDLYARGEYWEGRVKMMQHWSDHLDVLREGAKIVTGRFPKRENAE